MSKAAILCVGDELISGDITDTHGALLARFLRSHGIPVEKVILAGDDERALLAELSALCSRVDLVVVTGGLGPTSDDRTRDALGMLAGQALEFDEALWKDIQECVGRALSGSNRTQAFRPPLYEPLRNTSGTAPGLMGEIGGCRVVALPGPPRELTAMLDAHGETIVRDIGSQMPDSLVFTCFGIAESRLEDALQEASRAAGITMEWHTRAQPGRIVVRLVSGDDRERREVLASLENVFGAERFAPGETSLAGELVRELASAGVTVAAAESCTGGLLGAELTSVPGSSRVFWGSLVTYANEAKTAVLKVPEAGLEAYGAVSEETVVEMARSVRRISGSDFALSISGIAGPDGGTAAKPVGTVWIGISSAVGTDAREFRFSGGRERVRRWAMVEALLMLRSRVALLDSP